MIDSPIKLDSQDTLLEAIDDAMARSKAVFGNSKKTLVDCISQSEWDNWDASNEQANVCDSDALAEDISSSIPRTAA